MILLLPYHTVCLQRGKLVYVSDLIHSFIHSIPFTYHSFYIPLIFIYFTFIFLLYLTHLRMAPRKRGASDDEGLQEVQKRSKTRGQTRQRAEEEARDLMTTMRGNFRSHSFGLLNRTHRREGSRAAKEKAIHEAREFTSVQFQLLYSVCTQDGWPISGGMGNQPRGRPR